MCVRLLACLRCFWTDKVDNRVAEQVPTERGHDGRFAYPAQVYDRHAGGLCGTARCLSVRVVESIPGLVIPSHGMPERSNNGRQVGLCPGGFGWTRPAVRCRTIRSYHTRDKPRCESF